MIPSKIVFSKSDRDCPKCGSHQTRVYTTKGDTHYRKCKKCGKTFKQITQRIYL